MSRIRSIHPGLFTDEAFMSASIPARVLIIGLWTEAWDDGVFEWKPLTLKARIFPVDPVNVEDLLGELIGLGFVGPFYARDKKFGAIRNFQKWQRPKKPNSSGVLPDDLAAFVGKSETSSEPVPNQSPTGTEKPPQREDGGGRMEDEKKESVARVAPPTPPKEPKSKGTRLPDDWQPSASDIAYGHEKGLHAPEIARATERFKFWAASASGPNAIKRNWSMAYRNWLLTDAEKLGRSGPAPAASVEAVPQFQTEEDFDAWWDARRAAP